MEIEGEREYKLDNFTTLQPFANGDLYLSVMKGAAGLGDPLLRPVEAVEADVREEHLLPRFAESVYGVGRDRDAASERGGCGERLERARPVREWWARARAGAGAGRDRAGEAHVRGVVPALAALRGRVPRLLGPAGGLRVGGRDADGGGRAAPSRARSRRRRRPPSSWPARGSESSSRRGPVGGDPRARDARGHARREALAPRRSRTSSPATRTPTGSTSGSRCSRSGSPTTTRSCCRWARG